MFHLYDESRLRSLTKLVTWRLLQIFNYLISTYITTGDLKLGAQLAGVALVVNSTIYWAHERFWNNFDWKRAPDIVTKFSESWVRTVGKMIIWRICMFSSSYLIAYLVSGSWKTGATVMSVIILFNFFYYWAHERIWNRVSWGKQVREHAN